MIKRKVKLERERERKRKRVYEGKIFTEIKRIRQNKLGKYLLF
jgi:hypothetical protein